MRIDSLDPGDWESVRSIYAEGIASGVATFDAEPQSWEAWNDSHLPRPRLKAVEDARVIGWTALSPFSRRTVYSGVAEVGIYVAADRRGRGVGKALLSRLVEESEKLGIWTLQAAIIDSNEPSLALHGACGFRRVGVRERLGRLNGIWRDVVLMERRSPRVGS